MKKIIKYLTVMLLMACSSEKHEVQKCESRLGFLLPVPYKILSVKRESIGADYSTRIEIEFDSSSFDRLSRQIVNSPLFSNENSPKTFESLMTKVKIKNVEGFWISSDDDFKFVQLKNPNEPITCVVNKKTRKMVYQFSHI